ncbi:HAD-IA family hydrolase [Pseudooceanicola onchidii]|uniref:HAD-IA family hydrolase n=1 Tax=Pseudooceanicola onchidii TaxID=2562279 RepID=UPI0010AA97CB|nr:HAD-IA family hydrolase [Pseudooceanicola onchidii]
MAPLVCFDCDGVLVDSEPLSAQCMADLLSGFGIRLTWQEANAIFVGKTTADALALIEARYGVHMTPADMAPFDAMLFPRFRAALQPVPGIAHAIASLDLPVCVTSNSGHDRLALSLALTGLDGLFGPHVFSAQDVARGKPAPDLFHFAATRMGTHAARCIVIDDSVTGITGAIAAGARAIGFTGGGHCGPDHARTLQAAGAQVVVGHAADLPRAIAALTAPA